MKIAIQGEAGSFSHEAAQRMVPGCQVVSCARSVEVFDRLKKGSVAAAVIPIENTLAGTVAEHADRGNTNRGSTRCQMQKLTAGKFHIRHGVPVEDWRSRRVKMPTLRAIISMGRPRRNRRAAPLNEMAGTSPAIAQIVADPGPFSRAAPA